MKKSLILILLITISGAIRAQFSPQVSHFMYDQLRTNPGSAGSTDMICATMLYRWQMIGFEGNPTTPLFEVDAPFKLLGLQHGVGFSAYQDKLGFYKNTQFSLTYAYRFKIGNGMLGIGIQGSMFKNELIDVNWITSSGDGPSSADNSIPQGSPSKSSFSLAAGLFYRTEDIYFGVSSINLNTPKVTSFSSTGSGTDATYTVVRQYYVTAGYTMQLTNPVYELKPAVQLKSDGVTTDMDINLTLMYNKSIWGGVTYRTGEAVVALFGFELTRLMPGLKVGASYDFLTSSLSTGTETWELLVGYSFKLGVEKAPQKYKSIRFL
jgi:type IX secretion system PorP/SprF family membrane protein